MRLRKMRHKVLAAHRLARFGAAKLQDRPIDRRAAKIVVEGDDAMNLGPRQIERLRNEADGGVVDIAKVSLQGVQNRQHRAVERPMVFNDPARIIGVPGRTARHRFAPVAPAS